MRGFLLGLWAGCHIKPAHLARQIDILITQECQAKFFQHVNGWAIVRQAISVNLVKAICVPAMIKQGRTNFICISLALMGLGHGIADIRRIKGFAFDKTDQSNRALCILFNGNTHSKSQLFIILAKAQIDVIARSRKIMDIAIADEPDPARFVQ